jgi:hypothetical protein
MSHSSSRKRALDGGMPLAHRASHARSCVNHVANRLELSREKLLDKVRRELGVDLNDPESGSDIVRALEYIESL